MVEVDCEQRILQYKLKLEYIWFWKYYTISVWSWIYRTVLTEKTPLTIIVKLRLLTVFKQDNHLDLQYHPFRCEFQP